MKISFELGPRDRQARPGEILKLRPVQTYSGACHPLCLLPPGGLTRPNALFVQIYRQNLNTCLGKIPGFDVS